jgi:PAS domain S-box-containing protein
MRRRDGSEIWVEDHGHYLYDEQGNIQFHAGILRDVTSRVIAEAERQRAEEHLQQFKTIMDESNDAVFIIDPVTSQYQYFNRRACTLLGYEQSELSQLYVLDIAAHVTSMDIWLERVKQVRAGNGLIFDTHYRRKDGSTFPVEVSARLLESAEGETVVAFARDITERRRAEQERERLIRELEAKNTELERFTYTVSHDLKAPLVTIRGFLGYLEKDVREGKAEHVSHDVLRINGAVEKMQALLNDLLELSRIGRLMNEPEAVPFNDLVADALEAVHGRLTARGITVQTQPGLSTVLGDRRRLTEVLQNLLDNAAKFMGDQPTPRILIGQRGPDEASGNPVFFVQDNGIGIDPEHHERIFGLFNKLNVNTEGTGIGLALVRRIVEFHSGRIWVESAPGQGTTFCFTLKAPAA